MTVEHVTEEISLIQILRVINNYKISILLCTALASAIAVVVALGMPNVYRSTAVTIPLESSNSTSQMSQIASKIPLAGLTLGSLGRGDTMTKMSVMLNSRTLAKKVASQLRDELYANLFSESWNKETSTWKNLKEIPSEVKIADTLISHMTFNSDIKTGALSITAEFTDKVLAQKTVNLYLDTLKEFVNKNSLTMVERRKIFIENQLRQNKMRLLQEGKDLSSFYQTYSISDAKSLVTADLNDESPAIVLDDKSSKSNNALPTTLRDVPAELYLKYLTGRQKTLSALNGMLEQQYQMAKIEAAYEEMAFQLIDPPEIAYKKSKPFRSVIALTGAGIGVVAGIIQAFLRNYRKFLLD